MHADQELRDLGDAAALVAERLVEPIEGMHRVISARGFRYVGRPGAKVRDIHDALVGGIYFSIRSGAHLIGSGVGAIVASRGPEARPMSEAPVGAGIQAALNAVWGDELAARGNALAVSLSVRSDGAPVALGRPSLAHTYPDATNHVVVLLHGLGQTEKTWDSPLSDGAPGLHDQMEAHSTLTPVSVRFNSGLPVEETATALAEMLESLWENWPSRAPRLSLVGYSMGGLIARGAYAAGLAAGHRWAEKALDLITVGAPHHGSPVARSLSVGSFALRLARTTRPLSDFLESASAGIKDLQDGAGVAEAWEEAAAGAISGSSDIRQHFVAAVVTGDAGHPFGVLVGDLVVRVDSATGRSLAPENVHVLGSRRHFGLLSDPDVAHQVIEWLEHDSSQPLRRS